MMSEIEMTTLKNTNDKALAGSMKKAPKRSPRKQDKISNIQQGMPKEEGNRSLHFFLGHSLLDILRLKKKAGAINGKALSILTSKAGGLTQI